MTQSANRTKQLREFLSLRLELRRVISEINGVNANTADGDGPVVSFTSCQKVGTVWDLAAHIYLRELKGESTTVNDLETLLGTSKTNTLRLLNKLERSGIANRAKDDRDKRRTIVRLSPHFIERLLAVLDGARSN